MGSTSINAKRLTPALAVALSLGLTACGSSFVPKYQKIAKASPLAPSKNPTTKPPTIEVPTLPAGSLASAGSVTRPAQPQHEVPQAPVKKTADQVFADAKEYVEDLSTSLPLAVFFRVPEAKKSPARLFVGMQCKHQLKKIMATKASATNLKNELPKDLCDTSFMGRKGEKVRLVKNAFISRQVKSGYLFTNEKQFSAVLRADLTVAAISSKEGVPGKQKVRVVQITKDGAREEAIQEAGKTEISWTKGPVKFTATSRPANQSRLVSMKQLYDSSYADGWLYVVETVYAPYDDPRGHHPEQVGCSVVINGENRDIPGRCFHTRAELATR